MAPNKRRKVVDSEKEEAARQRDLDFAVYENQFEGLPMPSKSSIRKRSSVVGAIQKPKKPTKLA